MAKKAKELHLSKYAAKQARRLAEAQQQTQTPSAVDVVQPEIGRVASTGVGTSTMGGSKANRDHACFSIVIEKRPDIGWAVAAVADLRFNRADRLVELKFPGGTNQEALWENREQTLLREAEEEAKIKPISFGVIHDEFLPARKPGQRDHTKYFWLVEKYEGEFLERQFEDRDGVRILAKWIPIKEFSALVFRNHRAAFENAVQHLHRVNPDFHAENPGL